MSLLGHHALSAQSLLRAVFSAETDASVSSNEADNASVGGCERTPKQRRQLPSGQLPNRQGARDAAQQRPQRLAAQIEAQLHHLQRQLACSGLALMLMLGVWIVGREDRAWIARGRLGGLTRYVLTYAASTHDTAKCT